MSEDSEKKMCKAIEMAMRVWFYLEWEKEKERYLLPVLLPVGFVKRMEELFEAMGARERCIEGLEAFVKDHFLKGIGVMLKEFAEKEGGIEELEEILGKGEGDE